MKRLWTFAVVAFLAAGVSLIAGCVEPVRGDYRDGRRGDGYPPYAPNNGYFYRYQGANLRYEVPLGVYVVVGRPDIFFYRDHYVRWRNDRWERCDRLDGRWDVFDGRGLPDGLVRRYRNEGRGGDEGRRGGPGNGPPPFAPANGYRWRHDEMDLVYDGPRGVYVIPGRDNVYFYEDRYLRERNGKWEKGMRMDGPWRPAEDRDLPAGLLKKNNEPPGRGQGRGNEPPGQGQGQGQGRGRGQGN